MSRKQKTEQNGAQAPSKQEMQEALLRSGYLMEGRLVKILDGLDFFVEPSSSYLDEKTGISREVDLVAEHSKSYIRREKACVKTVFVIEAVNNLFPIALLTEQTWNPNANSDDYIPYIYTPSVNQTDHPFASEIYLWEQKSVLKWQLFCQYCAFSRKKNGGELFASHSDDLYSSINKGVEYSLTLRSHSDSWMKKSRNDSYWRIFQWRPIIVVRDDLYIYENNKLLSVDCCKLVYNLHFKSTPMSVVVDFVTESGLTDLVKKIVAEDDALEEKLYQLRLKKKT